MRRCEVVKLLGGAATGLRSKRVNSSKADKDDATLIEAVSWPRDRGRSGRRFPSI
jgi:hypothetical protein